MSNQTGGAADGAKSGSAAIGGTGRSGQALRDELRTASLQVLRRCRLVRRRCIGRLVAAGNIGAIAAVRAASLRILFLHLVRIGMRFNAARGIDARRIDDLPILSRGPAARRHESRATQVADGFHGFAGSEPVRQIHQGTLGIAEQQDVRFRIGQH